MTDRKQTKEIVKAAVDIASDTVPGDIAELRVSADDWAATPLSVREAVWRRLIELSNGMEQYREKAEKYDKLPSFKMGELFGMGLPMGLARPETIGPLVSGAKNA